MISSLRKPYQIIQTMPQPMVNDQGREIPAKFFTMRQELVKGDYGRVASDRFVPVDSGDKLLFTSDNSGSPAEIIITYRLTPSLEIPPGNYQTQVFYSLLEL